MGRLLRANRASLGVAILATTLLIGLLDYVTGTEFSFFVFYFIPVAAAAWWLGRPAGAVTAFGCAVVWFGVEVVSGHVYGWWLNRYLDTGIRLVAYLVLAGCVSVVHESLLRERELTRELTEALDNVRQLRGLIPICAACKNIRNDEGYWQRIETYIRDHSEAEFSHGICPDCEKRLYPDDLLTRLYPEYASAPQEASAAESQPALRGKTGSP